MNRKVELTEPLLTVKCAMRVGKVGFAKLLNRSGPVPVLVDGLVTVSQLGESLEIVHEQLAGETMTPKLPFVPDNPEKTKPPGKSVSRTEIEVQSTAIKGLAEKAPSNANTKPKAGVGVKNVRRFMRDKRFSTFDKDAKAFQASPRLIGNRRSVATVLMICPCIQPAHRRPASSIQPALCVCC